MNNPLEHDMDSLDLYMEVLRIVQNHPHSNAEIVFRHATLAMDLSSCTNALESLVSQGLLKVSDASYTTTEQGLKALQPVPRGGNFPNASAVTYVQILPPLAPSASTISIRTQQNICTITKNGVALEFNAAELQQLWKKMQRELEAYD